MTVLVCANMSGSEKMPLLVIEKSAKPRAFRNKEPPLEYKANKKAWMTADLFEAWLKNGIASLNAKEGRFSCFWITSRDTSTASWTISRSSSCHRIQQLLHSRAIRALSIDDNISYKVDLLKALKFLKKSWKEVMPQTIANCFRKTGFIKNVEAMDVTLVEEVLKLTLDEDVELTQEVDDLNFFWTELAVLELVQGNVEDYMAVDDQLAVGGTLF